jgi:hypothetical protein
MSNQPLRHIVLFSLKPTLTDAERDEAVHLLRNLGNRSDGVLEWSVELSRDTRKGVIIVENALFVDEQAYDVFRTSALHQATGQRMSLIADWLIADYFESF